MSDFDLAAYLDIFKEDVSEHLERMSAGLLALEGNPRDRQPIDDLFRSAHTVKGSARMMGLEHIASLAHRMEDLFSAFRSGAVAPTVQHVSVLLRALDELKLFVENAGVGNGAGEAAESSTVAELRAALDRTIADGPALRLEDRAPVDDAPPAHTSDFGAVASGQPPAEASGAEFPQEPLGGASVRQREFVRVSVGKVDAILNLAGALAIRRGDERRQFELLRGLASRVDDIERMLSRADISAAQVLAQQLSHQLQQLARQQRAETALRAEMLADLHAEITRMRMLPLSSALGVFQRTLRDLGVSTGKQVQLVVDGVETEVDKLILEGIQEPLLHLLRNAVDHGIEPPLERERLGKPLPGTVRIEARQHGDRVEIAVGDDGAGIDVERIRQKALARGLMSEHQARDASADELLFLVFVSGFSTRDEITEYSGRGVGMDAVRAAVAELDGQVIVHSELGVGTRVAISLPLTLAYTRVLLVTVEGQTFGVPAVGVESVYEVREESVSWLQARAAISAGGRTLPLVSLAQTLRVATNAWIPQETQAVVVLRSGAQRVAFAVDRLLGEETVVSKSLGPLLAGDPLVTGGAILTDGTVALLLNVTSLIDDALLGETQPRTERDHRERPAPRRVLVVDDTAITRELERSILMGAGYEVETAVDGVDALEKLSAAVFDGIVTDVEMPRLNGIDLTRTLRRDERWRDLPVVMVTTRESAEDRRRGLEAGAQGYLLKGAFEQATLIDTLRRLVG